MPWLFLKAEVAQNAPERRKCGRITCLLHGHVMAAHLPARMPYRKTGFPVIVIIRLGGIPQTEIWQKTIGRRVSPPPEAFSLLYLYPCIPISLYPTYHYGAPPQGGLSV